MLKAILSAAATVVLAASALPAQAQSTLGPTPLEQNGMHTGTTTTNGSAVMVTDRNGTHPEGYVGMAIRNRASGDPGKPSHRHHRHWRHAETPAAPN